MADKKKAKVKSQPKGTKRVMAKGKSTKGKSTKGKAKAKRTPKPMLPETVAYRDARGFVEHNDKSRENLVKEGRFVKGVASNPLGIKKGQISLTQILRRLLAAPADPANQPKTRKEKISQAEALLYRMLQHAFSQRPDSAAPYIRMIFQRVDGKAREESQHEAVENRVHAAVSQLEAAIHAVLPDGSKKDKLLAGLGLVDAEPNEMLVDLDNPAGATVKMGGVQSDSKQRAIDFYQTIVNDAGAPVQARIRAQERLDLLQGHVSEAENGSDAESLAADIRAFVEAAEMTGADKSELEGTSDDND